MTTLLSQPRASHRRPLQFKIGSQAMHVTQTLLPGLLILEPRVFADSRGFFMESYNACAFAEATGVDAPFVQENHSRSSRGVLRGLHYQLHEPQAKLVRVVAGEIYDVAVDLRRSSPTFGEHVGLRMSADEHRMLYIPEGFAHGFCVLSESADILYKASGYYNPSDEQTLLWSDKTLNIHWPLPASIPPILSPKDERGVPFNQAETYP